MRASLHRTLAALLAALAAAALLAEPVATVNGKPIDQTTLYEYMLKRYGSRSLVNLITAEVIRQAAEKQGITCTDAEIDAGIAKKRRSMDLTAVETGADFDMIMLLQGDTETILRESERTLILLKKMVAKDATLTDQRVQEYYQQHAAEFRLKEGMRVSYVRMDDKDKLSEVRQNVVAGNLTFAAAAAQFSNDTATNASGGQLDRWLRRGETAFLKAAFSLLADGDTSDIIGMPRLGYYLIRRDQYARLAFAKQRELMKAAKAEFLLQWPDGTFAPLKSPDDAAAAAPGQP
jgi:parvulin-like peptidyl-prolyl isomerase